MTSSLFSTASLAGLLGGLLIGLSASLLWVMNGRIAGISGIVGGMFGAPLRELTWRGAFVAGLVLAGVVGVVLQPAVFGAANPQPIGRLLAAGLLVGTGTALGSGCTSGHGVCGLARFSERSLFATLTFIGVGMLTVAVMRVLTGGAL